MKIKNFDSVVKQIQTFLPDFLTEHQIDITKNFTCLSPTHNDSKPSMSLVAPDSLRVHCHGCGARGDIFDVSHWLDNKPLTGNAFIVETLQFLAAKYEIEVEHTELTEQELYELDTYRAYKYAADYITSWKEVPTEIETEFNRRGWDSESYNNLKSLGVGFVSNPVEYRTYLKSLGFAAKFLDDVDLGRKDIFSPGHIVFTIKDEFGRPVGFSARNLTDQGPKYVNQKTTGLKCNIYNKGQRLYGFDTALRDRHEGPIYIMEGQADVISSKLRGFNRCVATCGTALTDDHLYLLKRHSIYNVVLCFDADDPGLTKTEQLLDTKFSEHKDIIVKIVSLPEGQDPDEFINAQGIESFKKLKQWSAFNWRLNRIDEEEDQEIICKKMLPHIVSEPSHVSQEKMLQELHKYTGFSLRTLQNELHRLVNDKERAKNRDRQTIIDTHIHELKQDPSMAGTSLIEAQSKLFALEQEYDNDSFSEEATFKFCMDVKEVEEEKSGEFQGMVLGPDLQELQDALAGEWTDSLFIFGGAANAGKTSLMTKISHAIARHEIENNACVIYHTIDDTAEQVLPKFVCIDEGSRRLQINEVRNPNYVQRTETEDVYEDVKIRRESGYQGVLDLIRSGRLVLKDANDGSSLGFARQLIKYYKDKYPDRQVVYVLDNFHKLSDFEGGAYKDERTRFKKMSTVVKGLATSFHIPVLCTMEYTKLPPKDKPSNNNIAESVQMEYDSNLIAHVWNGLHAMGNSATEEMYHMDMEREGPVRKPVVELNIGKNKISAFKETLYFRFYPASSDFLEQPREVILAAREAQQTANPGRAGVAPRGIFAS